MGEVGRGRFLEVETGLKVLSFSEADLKKRKRLLKQLSMCEAPRDKAWERRKRQERGGSRTKNRRPRRNSFHVCDNITDDDLHELKGCIELGFGFNEEDGQQLCHTLPALDLYFAVNRQLSPSPVSTPLSHRSSSFPSPVTATPPSDSDSWKICNPVRQKVQLFLDAARTGSIDLLKKLAVQLDEGKDLAKSVEAIKDANKRGALHFAAREGQTAVCQYLLTDLNLPVDSRDDDGETALIHAARQGHTATAKYLIDHGADPTVASNLGATALHHSAGIGDIDLLKYLLSRGVNPDLESDAGTPLVWAAGHAQPPAVSVLLEHGANPNAETEDGITPLLSAVAAGSLACLELLIQADAKVNISAGGATPLHIAADNGSLELINCLLKAGADPNVSDEDGVKPVMVAAARGHRGVVEMLFPLTSKIDTVPTWTMDGILEYMQSETKEQQDKMVSAKETNQPNDAVSPEQTVPEVAPEAKKRAAEAKARGDEAFKRSDFSMAIDSYTQAIDLNPADATLLSNRSLCWIRLGQADHALADAKACRALRPDWPKACYREGAALRKFDEAANAFYEGVKLDPENKELVNAFSALESAGV
ncbi:hypothetical protein Fmac_007081 [Flemingia macrophylla]|uniref:Serine/threonine-protein kinase BSK1-like TPR repeats domain-containing protein n=1 Tax=Flemingia macrophylla TaxID=520843 RepID=A0ABD1NCX6_9FABA